LQKANHKILLTSNSRKS